MSKGKDISTMFTREENKKNGRLGYCQDKSEKLSLILHSAERFYRKEVEENE